MTHIALSVMGKDRPGIVATVTRILFETGCNIEDSSMTLLRSEFAMILIVSLPRNVSKTTLNKKLAAACGRQGLSCSLRPLSPAEGKAERSRGLPCIITVYGGDRPGIVYTISSCLTGRGINITDVQTSCSGKGKKAVYIMFLETVLPTKRDFETVKTELESIGRSLNVTVTVNPVETPSL